MDKDTLVEKRYGTGAIANKLDLRDKKYDKIAYASVPFNWEVGYDIESELQKHLKNPNFLIPVKHQGVSYSCVGQAAAYYESVQDAFEKGMYVERSARDGYSQIFYPQTGGSTIRDALNLLVKKGVCKEEMMISYENGRVPSELFIRSRKDASPLTIANANTAKGTAYATVKPNIESIAQAIRDNHGVIFTVAGQNNGTWLSEFPKTPTLFEWSHAVYAGKARLINGRKYIGILNSWGTECGNRGWQWIGEDYMPHVRNVGVIYDSTKDVLIQQKRLLEDLKELLQRLINSLGYNSKKVLN